MQHNEIGFFFNMKFYRHLSYNKKYDVRLECVLIEVHSIMIDNWRKQSLT